MKELNKLEFEMNYNNKLLCLNFVSIVPRIYMYEPGEKFQVRINKAHFCFVKVIMKKDLTFDEIVNAGYNYIDAGLAPEQYYEYLCKKFGGTKWWVGKDSIFNVVWFEKITQLDMFENNEIFKKDE